MTSTAASCLIEPCRTPRAHKNAAIVALANKPARIAWVVLARGRAYEAAATAG